MYSVLALILVVCASLTRGDEEGSVMVMNAFKKCNAENPLSDDEMKQIKAKQGVPQSHNAKCMMACMMKEGKMLSDGVYHKDNAMLFADILNKDNPEQAAKAKQLVETCTNQVGSNSGGDDCEFAFKMATCAAAEAERLGIVCPDM
uniref:Odorant binding protein 5 n=1 Tax=Pachypeltis micranthus TaxID=1983339 RepID=A0A1W6QYN2_9HEMI|nr:odorant binding protein 5 [Pachypeltis micranthus]